MIDKLHVYKAVVCLNVTQLSVSDIENQRKKILQFL